MKKWIFIRFYKDRLMDIRMYACVASLFLIQCLPSTVFPIEIQSQFPCFVFFFVSHYYIIIKLFTQTRIDTNKRKKRNKFSYRYKNRIFILIVPLDFQFEWIPQNVSKIKIRNETCRAGILNICVCWISSNPSRFEFYLHGEII